MFCNYCGSNIPDGAGFCTKCGKAVVSAQSAPAPTAAPLNPYAAPMGGYAMPMAPKVPVGLNAMMSFILGISSAALGLLFAIISIILMANGDYFYGVGGLFISMFNTIGLCAGGIGLVYAIAAKKKADNPTFSLVGLICSAAGIFLTFLSFIFLIVIAA